MLYASFYPIRTNPHLPLSLSTSIFLPYTYLFPCSIPCSIILLFLTCVLPSTSLPLPIPNFLHPMLYSPSIIHSILTFIPNTIPLYLIIYVPPSLLPCVPRVSQSIPLYSLSPPSLSTPPPIPLHPLSHVYFILHLSLPMSLRLFSSCPFICPPSILLSIRPFFPCFIPPSFLHHIPLLSFSPSVLPVSRPPSLFSSSFYIAVGKHSDIGELHKFYAICGWKFS